MDTEAGQREAGRTSLASAYELGARSPSRPSATLLPQSLRLRPGHRMVLREDTRARALEPMCPAGWQTFNLSGTWGQNLRSPACFLFPLGHQHLGGKEEGGGAAAGRPP